MSNYVETIGYGGPEPLAIIFWYKEETPVCKTICYDEQDVITMHDRHKTVGDYYNVLRPSLQLLGEGI